MNARRRSLIPAAAMLAALAVLAAAPANASAGSLLSGYGGPGAGSQAILGSTLVNGSGGGRPGGGSSGGNAADLAAPREAAGSAAEEGLATGGVSSGAAARPSSRSAAGDKSAARRGDRRAAGQAAEAPAGQASTGTYTASQRSSAAGPFLGLSSWEIACVVFALCVLLFTGVLTERLRQGGTGEGGRHSSDVAQNPTN